MTADPNVVVVMVIDVLDDVVPCMKVIIFFEGC